MTNSAADWIDLSGKVAHVTGGAKGIGRGISRALAMAGASVMVSDVNLAGAEETASEIGGAAMALDVTDRDAVDAALAETVDALGGLDILVNNAGVYALPRQLLSIILIHSCLISPTKPKVIIGFCPFNWQFSNFHLSVVYDIFSIVTTHTMCCTNPNVSIFSFLD